MNSVIAETIDLIQEKAPASLHAMRVDELVIGVFFTGVRLSSRHAGVAFTPIAEIPEAVCCPTTAARMPQAGDLEGNPLAEILRLALDPNVLKSAIGVAALNAASQFISESGKGSEYRIVQNEDGFDLLKIQPQEAISLIGAFIPYIRRLKTMGNPFSIIEKNTQTLRPDEMKFFKPESEMASTLKKSDVVIITGTAIVNHSIDSILSCLRSGQRAAIIGPTASMLPDRFFDRGVQVMAGIRVLDPDRMTAILKQAGSAYHLKECSQKIAWIKD